MTYNLINIYTNSPYVEEEFTEKLLKAEAYNAKLKEKRTKQCSFLYVLVPNNRDFVYERDYNEQEISEFLTKHWSNYNQIATDDIYRTYYSLWEFFNEFNDLDFSIDFVDLLTDKDLDIYYTDGSSSMKKSTSASYACVAINEESYDENALFEGITDSCRHYDSYSGIINDATNNIGELSGVKKAISLRRNNDIQVIVSDSIYSIKSFREWIYNWKKNGYKGSSSKKPILNSELIQEIQADIEASKKIYLFKWTKGHDNTPFNEVCDRLAKDELGIK